MRNSSSRNSLFRCDEIIELNSVLNLGFPSISLARDYILIPNAHVDYMANCILSISEIFCREVLASSRADRSSSSWSTPMQVKSFDEQMQMLIHRIAEYYNYNFSISFRHAHVHHTQNGANSCIAKERNSSISTKFAWRLKPRRIA